MAPDSQLQSLRSQSALPNSFSLDLFFQSVLPCCFCFHEAPRDLTGLGSVFTFLAWRIQVLRVSLDASPLCFPAFRKRYLRRRAALGQLNTILLVARPLLWRRQRLQVRCLGGAPAPAPCWPSWPNPDSIHPPGPTTQSQGLRDHCWLSSSHFCLPGQSRLGRPGDHCLPSSLPVPRTHCSLQPKVSSHPLQPFRGAHLLPSLTG